MTRRLHCGATGLRRLIRCGLAAGLIACLEAREPASAIVPGLDTSAPGVDAGEILLGELNCVACHAAPAALTARLSAKPGPLLHAVASRARPEFIRSWLLDPVAAKPGTTAPGLLHDRPDSERQQAAEELTHFLVSLAPDGVPDDVPANPIAFAQGQVLFHRVGCVTCHAPLEPAAEVFPESTGPTDPDTIRFVLNRLGETSVPLGPVAAKYTRASLARFLLDPVAVRSSGRMPSLNLTLGEAVAIATYLVEHAPSSSAAAAATPFKLDRRKARAGRERFADLGCAACHRLAAGKPEPRSALRAPALIALAPSGLRGCLAEKPPAGVPRFHLQPAQREALRTTLERLTEITQPLSPAATITHTMTRLNCYGCHSRDGVGGPSPSRFDYFSTVSGADLGDEGRLPPHLSGVGAKLRPEWLAQVLTNHAIVRPYMGVRMPQFSAENVRQLAAAFPAADSVERPPAPIAQGVLEAGRTLAGTNGLSCITCHRFGPHPALGVSVMDMTQMARRLQKPWFHRYLLDPASLRPGTRMPMFWPDGEAALKNILDGNTEQQIESLWLFLSEGEKAKPPDGVPAAEQAPSPPAR